MRDKDSITENHIKATLPSSFVDHLRRAFVAAVLQKMPKPLYDGDGHVSYETVGRGCVSVHVEVQRDIGNVRYTKLALLRLMIKAILSLLAHPSRR